MHCTFEILLDYGECNATRNVISIEISVIWWLRLYWIISALITFFGNTLLINKLESMYRINKIKDHTARFPIKATSVHSFTLSWLHPCSVRTFWISTYHLWLGLPVGFILINWKQLQSCPFMLHVLLSVIFVEDWDYLLCILCPMKFLAYKRMNTMHLTHNILCSYHSPLYLSILGPDIIWTLF